VSSGRSLISILGVISFLEIHCQVRRLVKPRDVMGHCLFNRKVVIIIQSVLDFVPNGAEIGVGLNLFKDDYHLFFIPGNRFVFFDDEIFYAGIGGHLEDNETLIECAHREAWEEIGGKIELKSSSRTIYLPGEANKSLEEINVSDEIKPFALYEMVHLEGTPKQGDIYHIIIFRAELKEEPTEFKKDEISCLLGLTDNQVIKSIDREPTIQKLIDEGALIIGNTEDINLKNRVYPIGTAKAIAVILNKLKINGLPWKN